MKISQNEITTLYADNQIVEHAFLTAPLHTARHIWQRGSGLIDTTRACADLFTRLQFEGLLSSFRMGGDVLDCGTGIVALSLALTHARVCINGMDITPMHDFVPAQAHARQGVNVQISHRDVCHIPFAAAQFDLVVGSSRWIMAHEQVPALTELSRVLRPGAPLIIIVQDFDTMFRAQAECLAPDQVIATMQQMGLHNVQSCLISDSALENRAEVACIGINPTS